jgi:hypothetical protein
MSVKQIKLERDAQVREAVTEVLHFRHRISEMETLKDVNPRQYEFAKKSIEFLELLIKFRLDALRRLGIDLSKVKPVNYCTFCGRKTKGAVFVGDVSA